VTGSAKARIKATLRETIRLVDGLPEPVCLVLEKSGICNGWREQIGTLGRVTRLGGLVDVARQLAARFTR
jgi:hypothetical protein